MKQYSVSLFAVLIFAASVSAQDPRDVSFTDDLAVLPAAASTVDPDAFVTAIHRETDADGRPAGLWSTGVDFKVSFHDGMRFYPLLGDRYPHNLPWHWRTMAVRIGDEPRALAHDRPAQVTDWRVEYDLGSIVERWDVRRAGVEQSFVLAARPSTIEGDLVIEGQVTTPLFAAPRALRHAPLTFCDREIDPGRAIVEYGAAFAIDARGARIAVESSFDAGRLSLRVDGKWLASAAFPVVVDPLLAAVGIDPSNADPATAGAVAYAADNDSILAVYTRTAAGFDRDIFARRYSSNWTGGVTIFVNSIEFTSVRKPAVACIGRVATTGGQTDAPRFLVAFEYQTLGSVELGVGYIDLLTSLSTLDTLWSVLPRVSTVDHRLPDVGGTVHQGGRSVGLIVCEETTRSTGRTTVAGFRQFASRGVPQRVSFPGSPSVDRREPSVNPQAGANSEPWVVIFREAGGAQWQLRAMRVAPSTASATSSAAGLLGSPATVWDNLQPRVAGSNGRFLVTYRRDTIANPALQELRAARFDWIASAAEPTRFVDYTLRSLTSTTEQLEIVDLAFDTITQGHWGALSRRRGASGATSEGYADRLNDAQVAERTVLRDSGLAATPYGIDFHSTVAFGVVAPSRFHILFANPSRAGDVAGIDLQHAAGDPTEYGVGCIDTTLGLRAPATLGSRAFGVNGFNPAGTAPVVLWISRGVAALPLDALGFPGCVANLDFGASFLAAVPTTADGFGRIFVDFALPPTPTGPLHFQMGVLRASLPGGVGFTRGLSVTPRL